MGNPFITVFMPNYNNEKYLASSIISILSQTYANYELIILDDASGDDSWTIIQEFANKNDKIRTFKNNENLHVVNTRNKGFQLSSNESKYFAIIDSDDISLPNRLEEQISFLESNKEYGIVGSDAIIIDENDDVIGYRSYPSKDYEIRKKILRFNPFAQSSIIIRKSILDQIGDYDPEWKACSDYDLWLRIGQKSKFYNVKSNLIKYRISNTQMKSTNLKLTVQNTYRIQKKAIKKYEYEDTFYNKIYRLILMISSIYPKIAYWIYMISLKKKRSKK